MKKRSKNYRTIWENHNGMKIPKGYHIHHIDGDRTNDAPENLECLSPEEHVKKHLELGHKLINGKFIASASNRKGVPRSQEDIDKIRSAKIGIATHIPSKETKKKMSIANGGKPFKVFKNSAFIGEFYSLNGFCIEFGLNRRNVYKCLTSKPHYTVSGYTFKYSE